MSSRLSEHLCLYAKLRDENRRLGNHPQRELAATLRNRITSILRTLRKNSREGKLLHSESAIEHLGCDLDFFKEYVEQQFKPGMSWDNHGKWHLDHKRPCASFFFEDIEQIKLCFHYTNLQPLWALENMRKGAKWDEKPVPQVQLQVQQETMRQVCHYRHVRLISSEPSPKLLKQFAQYKNEQRPTLAASCLRQGEGVLEKISGQKEALQMDSGDAE